MARPRVPPWNLDADFAADLTRRGELRPLLDLVGKFVVFVDPRVVRAVPVVYPKTARIRSGRDRQGQVKNGVRLWTNQPAEAAIFGALGVPIDAWTGHIVCHVHPGSPSLPRHYTGLANLFLVPTTLASFTEWGPVLAALKWRAFELYGYRGPDTGRPGKPTLLPRRWKAPARLSPTRLAEVLARLRRVRRDSPMYIQPRAVARDWAVVRPESEDDPWWRVQIEERRARVLRAIDASEQRDLEAEFWTTIRREPRLWGLLRSWVVRHAFFAPPGVAAAVPNPFPLTRRARPAAGEKEDQVVDGIRLCVNKPARAAIIVACARSIPRTRGALVNHLWADAVFLPEQFAHLGGLVIVPRALGSAVDAEPVRTILQRRAFERFGYTGPSGVKPRRPRAMPDPWPENVYLTAKQQARAIARLERYRREIPGFYRKWRPGGPGRKPRSVT